MKKPLSLILAVILLASVLASCATSPAALDPRITVTSSDASDAAAWLSDRLGDRLTDRIVLGTATDGYGVDVSALEDDGYVIRSLGDEIALFAKTSQGLDRAARKYAKMAEAGTVEDVTYHEGCRVKRIEIAGRDIAEYTIFCENEPYMLSAANELSARIAEACGARLAVSSAEPAAPYIAFGYVRDEALGNVGHRWSVADGGVTIECSDKYKSQSALYAALRFLEKNLGWMGLIFGIEDLPAAELVEIAAGASLEESVAFDWALPCSVTTIPYDRLSNANGEYGVKMLCCHGMQANRFAGDMSASPDHNWAVDQPCWLDDTFYEASREDIVAFIEARLAAGAVIGEDFRFVDVSHGDNSGWCRCKKCTKMYAAEGGTHTAEILTWINALSDELDETYPGLMYGVFAYEMTKQPPKTVRPNEHITVSFCYDRCCSAHPMDGSKCTSCDQWTYSNAQLTEWLEGWLAICDYVTVWQYYMANSLLSTTFFHVIRDDVRFLAGAGVKQVFGCADDHGFSGNWIAFCLMSELYWNAEMSDAEYDALYDRLLHTFYGDAADDMRQYFEIFGRIEEYGSCQTCWGAYVPEAATCLTVDADTYAAKYDALLEIVEGAIPLANSAIGEKRIAMIGCSVIYTGSLCAYPTAKAAGDEARVDELCRRYDLLVERLGRYGVNADCKPSLKEIFPD